MSKLVKKRYYEDDVYDMERQYEMMIWGGLRPKRTMEYLQRHEKSN